MDIRRFKDLRYQHYQAHHPYQSRRQAISTAVEENAPKAGAANSKRGEEIAGR